jgi:hypothetical protein
MNFHDQVFPYEEWITSHKGNHVCIVNDEIAATVYRNKYEIWQIVINRDGRGFFVVDEYFEDFTAAMMRAEHILQGATCERKPAQVERHDC